MTTATDRTAGHGGVDDGRAQHWKDEAAALGRETGPTAGSALLASTAVSVAAGLFLTRVADGVVAFDVEVAEMLAAGRTSAVNALTAASTVLADSVNVAVLWVVAMVVAAWRTSSLRASVFLLTAIGGEKLTYLFTGMIVGRARPAVEPLGTVHATHSFPSGHVGSTLVLYGGIALAALWHDAKRNGRLRPLPIRVGGTALVVGAAFLVGYSRMYRGHHFLTDVLWGALLGVVWLLLAWRLVLRRHLESPSLPSGRS